MPVCVKKEKWPSQCWPRLFYSQPRQLTCAQAGANQGFSTASQGTCHVHKRTCHVHKLVPTKAFLQPAKAAAMCTAPHVQKPVSTKAFLQPAKAAAMCMAPRAETHPPPPIPPVLLAQNLSSKWIATTDNMRPKLHDEHIRLQWLKG